MTDDALGWSLWMTLGIGVASLLVVRSAEIPRVVLSCTVGSATDTIRHSALSLGLATTPDGWRRRGVSLRVGSAQAGMPLGFALLEAFHHASSCLASSLRCVAWSGQPAQVAERVVITWDVVVALMPYAFTLWLVRCRLTHATCSTLRCLDALGPVTR